MSRAHWNSHHVYVICRWLLIQRDHPVHFKAEESATQSDLVQWEVIFLLIGANKVQHQAWVGFTLTTQP